MKARIPLAQRIPYAWLTFREMCRKAGELSPRWHRHDGTLPAPNPRGIVFAACDRAYFDRHALAYLDSIATHSGRLSAHLHVYDGTDAQLAAVSELSMRYPRTPITVSRDAEAEPRLYSPFFFAAGRFVLLAELMAATSSPIVCTDVDVIVRGDLQPFVAGLGDDDVAFFFRLHNTSPWRKILASTVVTLPTVQGHRFAIRVARAMDVALQRRPGHHVDQLILYYAYRLNRLGILGPIRYGRLPQEVVDWHLREDSLIWNLKGSKRKAAYRPEAGVTRS